MKTLRNIGAILICLVALIVAYHRPANTLTANNTPYARQPGAMTLSAPDANGELADDEAAGGHLLARHVGQSEAQLLDRLAHSNISAASSFTDQATAEQAAAAAIERNKDKIENYLRSDRRNYLVVSYHSPTPLGISVARGESRAVPVNNAKFIITRDANSEKGYHIVTGYPTP